MLNLIPQFFSYISAIRISDIIDIFIVAIAVFFIIRVIRRTHASKVLFGVMVLLVFMWVSEELQLYTVNYILVKTAQIGLIALVVIFQPEIRRFLERIGTFTSIRSFFVNRPNLSSDEAITQTVLACGDMSESKTGALIVFERENSLEEQIQTGTIINADVTSELLKNLFFNKAPLHDGAVIVRDSRVYSAGCMLPLSSNSSLSRDLGMRHRAGIGLSEKYDAVVVIVSEETGNISVAIGGMLKRHLSQEALEKVLHVELINNELESEQNKNKFNVKKIFTKEKKSDE